MSSWEKDGKNFSRYFIKGKDLQFLSSKKKESDDSTATTKEEKVGEEVPF